MKKVIYFDMDGLITDLDASLAHFQQISLQEYESRKEKLNPSDRWTYIRTVLINYINAKGFIAMKPSVNLDAIKELIKTLQGLGHTVEILTSGTSDLNIAYEIIEQKKHWLVLNHMDHIKANFALGAAEKIRYCNENTILIDDYKRTIDEWNAKHPLSGCLYKDSKDSVKRLHDYLIDVLKL